MIAIRELRNRRQGHGVLATLVLAILWAACAEGPVAPVEDSPSPLLARKGKPPKCDASTLLRITVEPGALQGDAEGNVYIEGEDESLGAHLAGNGNLMFWTSQYGDPQRFVEVTTSAAVLPFATSDRIYTNNHRDEAENELACGFDDMAFDGSVGSSGDAVLEVELDSDGIVRYGKNCAGQLVHAARVVTTRSADGVTWTISGGSGVHCKKVSKRRKDPMDQIGTAGPVQMTLEAIPVIG
jgi:hypothetical protein